jgi:hypothetical protein
MNLTPEIVREMAGRLETLLPPPERRLVGVSMSPRMHQKLHRQHTLEPWRGILGVPVLIDPRMRGDQATAYYDARIWRRRCADQYSWDDQQCRTT